MTLTEKIVQIARSYVGQKEKPNNSGFVSAKKHYITLIIQLFISIF